jgi:hypothetical protein
MGNKTFELNIVALTVSLFFPVLIKMYLDVFEPTKAASIALSYVFIPGLYLLSLSLVCFSGIDKKALRFLFMAEFLLFGLFLVYIGLINQISSLNLFLQQPFIIFGGVVMFLIFAVIPALTLILIILMISIKSQQHQSPLLKLYS